jgi:hypothetical protein
MANARYCLRTEMIDVLLSLNFAAILYKIYFLFRLLQSLVTTFNNTQTVRRNNEAF